MIKFILSYIIIRWRLRKLACLRVSVKQGREVVRSTWALFEAGTWPRVSQWSFCSRISLFSCMAQVCETPSTWSADCPRRVAITSRKVWCPGRRPVGGGSTSCCSVSAWPRTSWRWTRTRTPFGRTCWGTGNGTEDYLQRDNVKRSIKKKTVSNETNSVWTLEGFYWWTEICRPVYVCGLKWNLKKTILL